MSSSIGQSPTFSSQQLVMNIVMDDWHLDIKYHGKWEGMTSDVGLASSVGDTIPRFTISIEENN